MYVGRQFQADGAAVGNELSDTEATVGAWYSKVTLGCRSKTCRILEHG